VANWKVHEVQLEVASAKRRLKVDSLLTYLTVRITCWPKMSDQGALRWTEGELGTATILAKRRRYYCRQLSIATDPRALVLVVTSVSLYIHPWAQFGTYDD
jgi:hypothetical protein